MTTGLQGCVKLLGGLLHENTDDSLIEHFTQKEKPRKTNQSKAMPQRKGNAGRRQNVASSLKTGKTRTARGGKSTKTSRRRMEMAHQRLHPDEVESLDSLRTRSDDLPRPLNSTASILARPYKNPYDVDKTEAISMFYGGGVYKEKLRPAEGPRLHHVETAVPSAWSSAKFVPRLTSSTPDDTPLKSTNQNAANNISRSADETLETYESQNVLHPWGRPLDDLGRSGQSAPLLGQEKENQNPVSMATPGWASKAEQGKNAKKSELEKRVTFEEGQEKAGERDSHLQHRISSETEASLQQLEKTTSELLAQTNAQLGMFNDYKYEAPSGGRSVEFTGLEGFSCKRSNNDHGDGLHMNNDYGSEQEGDLDLAGNLDLGADLAEYAFDRKREEDVANLNKVSTIETLNARQAIAEANALLRKTGPAASKVKKARSTDKARGQRPTKRPPFRPPGRQVVPPKPLPMVVPMATPAECDVDLEVDLRSRKQTMDNLASANNLLQGGASSFPADDVHILAETAADLASQMTSQNQAHSMRNLASANAILQDAMHSDGLLSPVDGFMSGARNTRNTDGNRSSKLVNVAPNLTMVSFQPISITSEHHPAANQHPRHNNPTNQQSRPIKPTNQNKEGDFQVLSCSAGNKEQLSGGPGHVNERHVAPSDQISANLDDLFPAKNNEVVELDGNDDAAMVLANENNNAILRDSAYYRSKEQQLKTLQYLLAELKSVPSTKKDSEVQRLVEEIDKVTQTVLPMMSSLHEHQVEFDLSMQPIRNENAQLRRRLRIVTQQLRAKENSEGPAKRYEPSFDMVHLQMLNSSLEAQLKEERILKEKLQDKVRMVTSELEKQSLSKREMLELITHKDTDHVRSQQDWVMESSKLRGELDDAKASRHVIEQKYEALLHEMEIARIDVQQKDREVVRLQELVRSLQQSLSNLLADLQSPSVSSAYPHLDWLPAVDQIRQAQSLLTPVETPTFEECLRDMTKTPPRVSNSSSQTTSQSSSQVTSQSSSSSGLALPVTSKKSNQNEARNASNSNVKKTAPSVKKIDAHPGRQSIGSDVTSSTCYLPPPGLIISNRPRPLEVTEEEFQGHIPSEAEAESEQLEGRASLTVREVLSGLASKMREQNFSSSVLPLTNQEHSGRPEHIDVLSGSASKMREQNFSSSVLPLTNQEHSGRPEHIDSISDVASVDEDEGDGKKTTTKPDGTCNAPSEISRFSITDYFKKYPANPQHSELTQTSIVENPTRESRANHEYSLDMNQWIDGMSSQIEKGRENKNSLPNRNNSDLRNWNSPLELSGTTDNTLKSVKDESDHQRGTYRGTELDTSLSSIKDTASETTTASTWSAFDEKAFRDGLASLDANIARVQQSLAKTKTNL